MTEDDSSVYWLYQDAVSGDVVQGLGDLHGISFLSEPRADGLSKNASVTAVQRAGQRPS